ncbi:MAG: hypothetical protein COA43_02555 [Robiginitomaculum sp.]|nr:MAG: hypothetical protein COA43_02555 [Robiginitomaculum sp.]
MKLTCPECTTQFLIDPNAIGSNGRTVRCSQCSSSWFVSSDPDVMDLRDNVKEVKNQRDMSDGQKLFGGETPAPKTAIDTSIYESSVLENHGMGEVDTVVAGAAAIAPHAALRDRAEKKKVRRRLLSVGMIWIVTLGILSTAALGAYLLRVKIVEKFPVTLEMYKAFNINIPLAGLEFYDIEWRYGRDNGIQILFVDGKIKNVDVKPRDVTMIKLSFKNPQGNVLASWVVEPNRSILKSGETLSFSTQYANPPQDATKLAASFASEDDVVIEIQSEK